MFEHLLLGQDIFEVELLVGLGEFSRQECFLHFSSVYAVGLFLGVQIVRDLDFQLVLQDRQDVGGSGTRIGPFADLLTEVQEYACQFLVICGGEGLEDHELCHLLKEVDEGQFSEDDEGSLAETPGIGGIFLLLEACVAEESIAGPE